MVCVPPVSITFIFLHPRPMGMEMPAHTALRPRAELSDFLTTGAGIRYYFLQ
jgi:hypothetical protein